MTRHTENVRQTDAAELAAIDVFKAAAELAAIDVFKAARPAGEPVNPWRW
jgi:hypothetical protein